jgi:hypothetical protein
MKGLKLAHLVVLLVLMRGCIDEGFKTGTFGGADGAKLEQYLGKV